MIVKVEADSFSGCLFLRISQDQTNLEDGWADFACCSLPCKFDYIEVHLSGFSIRSRSSPFLQPLVDKDIVLQLIELSIKQHCKIEYF